MISRLITKRSGKTGLPPGTLIHVGERKAVTTTITLMDYDESRLEERRLTAIEESFPYRDRPSVTWINVSGVHEVAVLEKLGQHFGIHPLVLEDIMNTGHRPKLEDMGEYLFLVVKMLYSGKNPAELEIEQLSMLVGRTFVISFREGDGEGFAQVRERIRAAHGKIRTAGADYLAYALLDAVVDGYFPIFEVIGEHLEDIEEELLAFPSEETSRRIHALKREMIFLRRVIWPLREVVARLERSESGLIQPSTLFYLRDVYDHVLLSIETVETSREMSSGLLDVYLSSVSNRLNDVMRVLTVIATIFIPLTFITGVFGMNFHHMPELSWPWAYPWAFWGIIILLAGLLIGYFRHRQWL
ncbi:MAG: magnesium/cobalt transporter CorA [Deltaproteobacteria bacterium]|jgi:magnesium transporter